MMHEMAMIAGDQSIRLNPLQILSPKRKTHFDADMPVA
jgi:hypothetical protein